MDQDGRPLRGVVVSNDPFGREAKWRTGEEGRIRLHLGESKAVVYLELDGYTGDRVEVPPGVNQVTGTLTRLRRVTIVVHAPAELHAEGEFRAEVSAGPGATVVAGEDGAYRGQAEIPVGHTAEVSIVSPDRRFEGRASVGPSESSVELTLAPRKLHPVTFRCVDEKGNPIADLRGALDDRNLMADVRIYFPKEIRADAEGRCNAKLPAGRMEVDIKSDHWSTEGFGQEFTVPAPEEVVLKFRER